jgi:serine/threonine-protein kinase
VPCQIGQYVLFKRIAAGAMGSVYTAYDEVLARRVALKIVSAPANKQDDLYQDALREARVQASINHPNVAQVYAMSEDMGQPYIIMELIEGGSVLGEIKAHGPVEESDALRIGINAAGGLFAAQKLGLLHRDMKPANLLLTRDRIAKVTDFGLAERVKNQGEGKVVGSPYYMAPEIAQGKVADHRADIYSLGATLFHMLTGQPPFRKEGATPREIVLRRFKVPPPDPAQHVPGLNELTSRMVQSMMSVEPDGRPEDYPKVIRRLKQALALIRRDQASGDSDGGDPGDALQGLSDAVRDRQ